ncbi:MAG: AraC-like DNA-binding protein [Cellvibrionaceae bacterium]|jgi:AraC-like DNA-binding protein
MIGNQNNVTHYKINGSADEWNVLVSSALGQLETRPVDHKRLFSGRLAHRSLGDLVCVNLHSNRLDVIRQERFISNSREDFFKVNFNLAGTARLEQDGRQTLLNPGDWVVYDNTRPYRLSFGDDYQQLVVLVPRAHFLAKLPNIHRLTVNGQAAHSGLGRTAWEVLMATGFGDGTATADIVTDLILGGLLEDRSSVSDFVLSSAARLVLVKQFIHHHLGDPKLGVAMICSHMHVSRRSLHYLFEAADLSAGNYIWRCRLEKTRIDLLSPQVNHLTTAEIAFRWGFSSAAHFNRRFKSAYGQTPKGYQKAEHELQTAI